MSTPIFDRLQKQSFPNTGWVKADGGHDVIVAKVRFTALSARLFTGISGRKLDEISVNVLSGMS